MKNSQYEGLLKILLLQIQNLRIYQKRLNNETRVPEKTVIDLKMSALVMPAETIPVLFFLATLPQHYLTGLETE
jgi:hypothetical protein